MQNKAWEVSPKQKDTCHRLLGFLTWLLGNCRRHHWGSCMWGVEAGAAVSSAGSSQGVFSKHFVPRADFVLRTKSISNVYLTAWKSSHPEKWGKAVFLPCVKCHVQHGAALSLTLLQPEEPQEWGWGTFFQKDRCGGKPSPHRWVEPPVSKSLLILDIFSLVSSAAVQWS